MTTDRWYTNAVELELIQFGVGLPGWLGDRLGKGMASRTISLSQLMYTPENIKTFEVQPDDRPNAGALMLGLAIDHVGEDLARRISLGVRLGVSGTRSGAGRTQRRVHRFVGAQNPNAWQHQLDDVVLAQVGVEANRRVKHWGSWLILNVGSAVVAGRPFTRAEGSVGFRAGRGAAALGPPRGMTPSVTLGEPLVLDDATGELAPLDGFTNGLPRSTRFVFLATGVARASLYNWTLGGNAFVGDERTTMVFDGILGFDLQHGRLLFSYRQVHRTKEFSSGDWQLFGSLSLGVLF